MTPGVNSPGNDRQAWGQDCFMKMKIHENDKKKIPISLEHQNGQP